MGTLGHLTGSVAHDFNNLLMAVLGSLTLLDKRMPEDPALRRLVHSALQGVQRGIESAGAPDRASDSAVGAAVELEIQ
jgi:hypothetical protein